MDIINEMNKLLEQHKYNISLQMSNGYCLFMKSKTLKKSELFVKKPNKNVYYKVGNITNPKLMYELFYGETNE